MVDSFVSFVLLYYYYTGLSRRVQGESEKIPKDFFGPFPDWGGMLPAMPPTMSEINSQGACMKLAALIADVLAISGAGVCFAGLWQICPPVALVIGGLVLVLVAGAIHYGSA